MGLLGTKTSPMDTCGSDLRGKALGVRCWALGNTKMYTGLDEIEHPKA